MKYVDLTKDQRDRFERWLGPAAKEINLSLYLTWIVSVLFLGMTATALIQFLS